MPGTGNVYEMLVSGPDGDGERVVSSDDYTQEDPAWRADGQKLVAIEEGTNPGIYEYNPGATNDKRRIVASPQNYVLDSPRYTDDGRIIFEGSTDTDGNGYTDATNIYSVAATCTACAFPGGVTQLTTDGDSGTPAWTGLDGFEAPGQAAVVDGALQLEARDGEANDIDVLPAPAGIAATAAGTVRLRDARGVDPGAGCAAIDATTVECADVETLTLATGDGSDVVDITAPVPADIDGGEGSDMLSGGPEPDTLDGGPGTDTLSYATRRAAVAVRLDGRANDGADPTATARRRHRGGRPGHRRRERARRHRGRPAHRGHRGEHAGRPLRRRHPRRRGSVATRSTAARAPTRSPTRAAPPRSPCGSTAHGTTAPTPTATARRRHRGGRPGHRR